MNGLGTKRQCQACYVKFYDMGAAKVSCPKCATELVIGAVVRNKTAAQKIESKPVKIKLADRKETIDGMSEIVELEEFDDLYEDIPHLEEVEDHHEEPEIDVNSDDAEDDMFIDEIGEDDVHLIDEPEDFDAEERDSL